MSKLSLLRGLSTNLDSNSLKDGQILFTEDTNELYIDFLNPTTSELDRKPITDKKLAEKVQQFINSLDKVENKSSEEIRDEITYENIIDALGFVPSAGSGSSFEAENIIYDNTESGLKGQDVQSALDELVEKNAVNQTGIIALQAEIEDKVSKDYVDKSINDLVDSAPDTMNTLKELATEIQNNQSVINTLDNAITNKVDKIDGKGLSTNDYTTEEKNKLATVSSGAEANVQSDWNITNDKDDAFIKNKPFIPTKTSDLTNDSGFKTTDNDTWKANTASSEGYVAKGEGQINKVWKTDSNGIPGWRNDNNTTYDVATTSSNGLMSSADKSKLNSITEGAEQNVQSDWNIIDTTNDGYIKNKPTIPTKTSQLTNDSGFKTTDTDTWKPNSSTSEGYVASGSGQVNKVWKTDADGVPAWRDDANTTYSNATQSSAGLLSASDKKKLDNIANGAEVNVQSDWNITDTGSDSYIKNKPTIPSKTSQLTNDSGFKTTDTWKANTATSEGYVAKGEGNANKVWKTDGNGVPGWRDDANTTYTLGSFGVTATKDELNVLDGITATTTELNYVDGVTSNIQTQLNAKVPTSRTVNNKALSSNITLGAADVGADPSGSAATALANAKTYVDGKIDAIVGEGASETLDTIGEISKAIEDHRDVTDALNAAIGNKVDKVSGKGLSTNDYTTTEKNKLSGIASGAEVNQNAFSNVIVGSTTISADSKTDSLTLAGSNVTITPDATNDKVTIGITKANVTAALGYTPPTTDTNTWKPNSASSEGYVAKGSGQANKVWKTNADGVPAWRDDSNTTYSNFVKSGSGAKAGLVPAPSTTAGTTKYLREDGTWQVPPDNNTTYSNMTAATSSAAGKAGLVPAPAAGAQAKFLRGDGTWQTPTNTTYSVVTASANGLVPMFDAADGTIDSSSNDWVLTNNNGSIGWYKLPANAFNNTTYSVATTSANGLMSAADKTKLDNTNEAYGTCSTAAATAAKVVTISGNTKWALKAGSRITIKFSATNTAQNPTLNVNNTGAKSIWYNTGLITTGNLGYAGTANRPMDFVYDGTQYVFMGWSLDNNTTYSPQSLGNGYGTCSTAAATAAKVVTLSGYNLITNGFVAVKFTNAVPASATMNINSKGAKSIYHKGAAIKANIIKAGDLAFFSYNGSQYHLIGIDRRPTVSGSKLIL